MAIPTDGLIFYAPLAEDKATAETGQEFTKTGTVGFSIQENIPCAYFNGSSFLKTTDAGFPTGKNPVTISFWAKQLGGNGSFFSYGKIYQTYSGLWLILNNDTENKYSVTVNFWGIFYRFGNSALDDKFHHFCIEIIPNEDSGTFYLDGIEQSVSLATNSTPGKSFDDINIQLSGTMEIGSYNDPQEGRKYLDGYLSSFRVYNRALGKAEIQDLANEFNDDSGSGGGSGNTGILIDGLFLSSSKPEQNQKGIIINNNFFIPLIEKGEFDAGVVVDVDGVSKVQPLAFDGLTPSASGSTEDYVAKVYATGMSEPDYIGTVQIGGSTFYKCASVDTSAKAWTGYRAVLNDGVYTFEDTVTTGLFYTSVTPQVGKIYSADALVYGVNLYQGIPTDGLVFYAPLYEKKTTAETGQIMSHGGSYSYETYQDVPSLVLNKGYVNVDDASTLKPLGSVFTLCFWSNTSSDEDITVFAVRDSIVTYWDTCCINGEYYLVEDRTKGRWYFTAYVQNGSIGQGYINGVKLSTQYNNTLDLNTATRLVIGARQDDSFSWIGALSSFRIYNRALSDKEISLLAAEFNI